jgi:hypothetical protein
MSFKKFFQFISEGKKPKEHDIEEVSVPDPKINADAPLSCPKCGSTKLPCECYTDDYYNSKLTQQTPRPNKIFKKNAKSK